MTKEVKMNKGQQIYDFGEVLIWTKFEFIEFGRRVDNTLWKEIVINKRINTKGKQGTLIREEKKLMIELNNSPIFGGLIRLTYLK